MYTSVHIIPERKRKWMPDSDFLMKLFEHIGIEKVWILTGYSKPLLWNSEFWRFEVFKEKNLAPEIAIKTWLERKAKVTDFDVDAEWGIDLSLIHI
ncbi:MAG: hypothetical protein N3A38_14690, partial [Planctomycetota bacterium]|nr:hypothetical protein [Planctomycetota bacterium]